jgi:hypothetical protein
MLHHCLIYCIANASYAELIRVQKMRINDRQFIAPIAILIPSNSRYDESGTQFFRMDLIMFCM